MNVSREDIGGENGKLQIPIELVQPHIEEMVRAWNSRNGRLYVQRFAADVVVAFRSKVLMGIDPVTAFFLKNEELERARIEFTILDYCEGFTKIRQNRTPVEARL